MEVSELKKDLDELKALANQAQRKRVKDILSIEIHKLNTEIVKKEDAERKKENTQSKEPEEKTSPVRQTSVVSTVQEKTYAWDQSEKFMKIYATLDDVQSLPKENITCDFTKRSFRLKVNNNKNKIHEWYVSNLMEEIVPSESSFKVKTGSVLVMLKKKQTGSKWEYVTEREHKAREAKKPNMDDKKDPNESLMDMLKQMYEDGDEDMRRSIGKAWTESQNKTPQL